jgi:hypothetical protein
MKGEKVDYQRIAARFRFFAEMCRQYAERYPSQTNEWLAKAVGWEKDAKRVERDGELIAESLAMLEQIELPGGGPRCATQAPDRRSGLLFDAPQRHKRMFTGYVDALACA